MTDLMIEYEKEQDGMAIKISFFNRSSKVDDYFNDWFNDWIWKN